MGCAAALGWKVVALVPLELVGRCQLRKIPPGLALPRCFAEYNLLKPFPYDETCICSRHLSGFGLTYLFIYFCIGNNGGSFQ